MATEPASLNGSLDSWLDDAFRYRQAAFVIAIDLVKQVLEMRGFDWKLKRIKEFL